MKIPASTKNVQTFDVELPLYRRHDTGGDNYDSVHYTRIDQVGDKLRAVTINTSHGFGTSEYSIETRVNSNYGFDSRSDPDYNLGRGEHALSKEEWDAALLDARKMLDEISA